ncbi:hypothetical protein B0T10DRAFT_106601 [Thelonectria olida]|uniref:Uncharacterized protein n=1 Tax=Thelonectria olida TaxID=1576542 RepID=A0A9P9AV00_9HYPO|nr:hypothetical protein B0T10DRAFT_106601 [Thelonectria olida]
MYRYTHSPDSREMAPPENQAHYINKPLPAPPIPRRSLSRNSTRQVPRRPGTAPPTSAEQFPPLSIPPIPRRSTSRASLANRSMPTSPIAERRSSIKVHQLTGQTVGICFDWTPSRGFSNHASPVLLGDDGSSSYCHSLDEPIYEEEDTHWARSSIPTLVSDDCDDMRSKRSSGGPLSPHSISGSTSRGEHRGLYGSAPDSIGFIGTSVDELDEDDSYNYLTDGDVADEYHAFTTTLAKVDKQRGREITSTPPISRSQSLTSRLSVSARSLFSRRRDPRGSIYPLGRSSMDTPRSHVEADLQHAQTLRLSQSDKSSINSPAFNSPTLSGSPDDDSTGPRSVFEYSEDDVTDDEETHMREVIREFFGPSHREEKKSETRTLNRKGRRHNLRAQIQVIPE